MKILLPVLFLIGFSSPTLADFNCDDLFGTWASDRYDNTMSSERRTIKALNADGSYWIKFIHGKGDAAIIQKEHGTWTCDGSVLGIQINRINDQPVNSYNEYRLVKPCLLYTSPSPRDKRQSRMPSSA